MVDALREEARIDALHAAEKLVRKLRYPDPVGGSAAIALGVILHTVVQRMRTYGIAVNIGDAIEHAAAMAEADARMLDARWYPRKP